MAFSTSGLQIAFKYSKYIGPILYLKSKQKYERRGNSTNFRKAFNLVLIKLFCCNESLFVQNWRKERKHIITKKVTAGIKDGRWLNILLEFTVFSVFSEKVGLKYGDFCRMP